MKLYALLTFLLALPLFVRLLPETTEDSATSSTSTAGQSQAGSTNQSAPESKAVQKTAPAAPEKQTVPSQNPTEAAH